MVAAGCSSAPPSDELTQQLIQERIMAYYDSLQVEGYEPLSYSSIDTVSLTRNDDGSTFSVTGEVKHTYLSGSGREKHSRVFEVQIYQDDVVVIPLENQPQERQRPTISI
ncbi:hypothetical protein [Pontibacter chitinilyticus]|uniref:hypothetical protein n=1 Tax=Pontibacter chitinilyticus TaxID=2674989 RepID=UPI00321C0D09